MKTYKQSILWVCFSSFIVAAMSAVQLLINVYYERIFFIVLFAIGTFGFLFYTIIVAADLFSNQSKFMKVTVVERNNEIIKVLKPNGSKRRIRVINIEVNKYQINQELTLTLTKNTGLIKEIKGEDQS